MSKQDLNFEIYSFDTSRLSDIEHFKHIIDAIFLIPKLQKSILICSPLGSFNSAILNLADEAPKLSESKIENKLNLIIDNHLKFINIYFSKEIQESLDLLQSFSTILKHIVSLLQGIRLVKEISSKTLRVLTSYSAKISALLIQASFYKHFTLNIPILIDENYEKIIEANQAIIPVTDLNHNIAIRSAELAIQYRARVLNIWTQLSGVKTADPKIIPQAKNINHLDYSTALEIAYLGGKILHPTAINMLKNKNIPIKIFSFSNPSVPSTSIENKKELDKSKKNSNSKCIIITTQDSFSLLSIRSTEMFDTYGYLERVFKTFNQLKIPVETLSTSEISISCTFATKYFSENLEEKLSGLGEIEFKHKQSIISIIGDNAYWKNASNFANTLKSLDKDVLINLVSLAHSGNNLSLIVDTDKKNNCLKSLHAILFEKK